MRDVLPHLWGEGGAFLRPLRHIGHGSVIFLLGMLLFEANPRK